MTQTTSSIAYNVVCFGEILWDILPDKAVPGGAPMNVAYHLHRLGERPALVTRIGIDKRGNDLLKIIKNKNLDTKYIQLDDKIPTGIVHAIPNEQGEMSYEFASSSAWDNILLDTEMVTAVKNAEYFLFGSLASRNQQSKETLFSLLEIANNKVLDINLRQPFFTSKLVSELLYKADILKLNITELELIAGWFTEYKSNKEKMEFIQNKFNIPSLILTMGSEGAIINFNGSWHQNTGIQVQVADTIGSGDSFLAAFLSQIIQRKSLKEAASFANGLGALVASKNRSLAGIFYKRYSFCLPIVSKYKLRNVDKLLIVLKIDFLIYKLNLYLRCRL